MASPFEQMQRQAMEGLYGMGLTGEMDIGEIRRKKMQMQQFSNQAKNVFGSMFQPQTETTTFGVPERMPSMPYSSTIMGQRGSYGPYSSSEMGGSSYNSSYSMGTDSRYQPNETTMNWSSIMAPKFPYSNLRY